MKPDTLKDAFGIQVTFGTGESGVDHSGIIAVIDPSSITPPGVDGGDPIDETTHTNADWRTKWPRSLVEIQDGTFTMMYDPDGWSAIAAAINDNVLITFTYPDGCGLEFFGYIKSFIPNEYVEGEPATAEVTLVVTNYDHATGLETAPNVIEGS